MPRELPQTPSLEHLRKQAKSLVRMHRAHEPEADAILARPPLTFGEHARHETRPDPLRLCEAQLAIARQYGFSSWAQLKANVDAITRTRRAMMAPADNALIANPGYRGRLAAQKGLPPVGAAAVSQYGMRYAVVDHAFAMTLVSVARLRDGEPVPLIEELLPVISFSGMSQRLNDLYIETDCCTTKELVFMDSMPELHPDSAAPGLHQVITTQDPRCLVFHLDAAHLHETILAHELGHVWIEMVEGCEDFRMPRFLADTPRAAQFQLIQSFALDFRVNALLQRRGFDLTIVDAEYLDAIVQIANHCARGERPRTERTAAALVNTVAAAMLDHDRWPESAVQCLETCLSKIRSGLPSVYRAARAFVASVEKRGVADRESICRVIDECALISFGLTGDDFDPERDLEERPPSEWMRDKHPDFLSGLPVPTKLGLWRAMAKQGIGPRIEYGLATISRGIVEITVRDMSGRQPAPPVLNICIPVAQLEAHPVQRRFPPGQRPGMPAPCQAPPASVPTDSLGMLPGGGVHGGERRYMPGVGRWLSRVGFAVPGIEHPYVYAANSPVMLSDPGGLAPPVRKGVKEYPNQKTCSQVMDCLKSDKKRWNCIKGQGCTTQHPVSMEMALCVFYQESRLDPDTGPNDNKGGIGQLTCPDAIHDLCRSDCSRGVTCDRHGNKHGVRGKSWCSGAQAAYIWLQCGRSVGSYGDKEAGTIPQLKACEACLKEHGTGSRTSCLDCLHKALPPGVKP